jgi:hypothetical protein
MNKAVKKIQKSTLLNIDSMFRNLYPKNIYSTNGVTLPSDPFVFTKGSSIININYPSHNLLTGDNIVIQNVTGISKSLINSIYLINSFNYYVIIFENNMIDIDYKNNTTELYATIEAMNQTDTNIFNNICFNDIVGYKQIFVGSADIPQRLLTAIYPTIQAIVGSNIITNTTTFTNYINTNCLFVPLPTNYINITADYYQIKQVFKISYQHIAGIKLGYLNSNYPISNINYQANQAVYNVIDNDNFMINLNYTAYGNYSGGGKNVQIMKIIDSIPGYPSANNYVINLKKSFNNVTKIELVGSEIPYVDIIIRKDVNDKLYWKHIQDGNAIYMLQIDEGFYSTTTLLNKIQTEINKVPRKITNSTTSSTTSSTTGIGTIYNNFDVNLETNINKITFTPYINTNVPNSFNVRLGPIGNELYYFLTINMHQSFVQVGDVITISKATDVTLVTDNNIIIIGGSYLNKDFKIYATNPENNTFDVIIGIQSSVTTSIGTTILNGGKDIIIRTKTKVSFLFDRKDTMGDILGFMNVGMKGSIIDFDYEQTNKKQYIASTNTDFVGNIINYSNGFINLSGKYTYILMYMNDIEYVHSTSSLASAFAKIQLNGNPGDLLFNTYVENPENIYSKSFPISNLTQLTISFTYPDGTPIEFRNVNHSFTLRIVEEHNETNDINLNSQNITFVDEMKKTVKQ